MKQPSLDIQPPPNPSPRPAGGAYCASGGITAASLSDRAALALAVSREQLKAERAAGDARHRAELSATLWAFLRDNLGINAAPEDIHGGDYILPITYTAPSRAMHGLAIRYTEQREQFNGAAGSFFLLHPCAQCLELCQYR